MTRWLAAATLLVLLAAGARAQAFAYADADLRAVIADVEARTDWRFLYPDALVAGKRVRVRAESEAFPAALAVALASQGVGVEADRARRRILLVPAPTSARTPAVAPTRRLVRGRVLDAETGVPLPFSTVTWDDGGRRGVVTDEGGGFALDLRGDAARAGTALTASFLGYRPQTAAPSGGSVVFRLAPEAVTQAPVVVDALALAAALDTAWTARLRPGRYDALGEGGGLRALEVLPSVAPAALFNDGPVVRGSASDAFEVRLDGVPIYNPRHLFGLVDAFNGDALRAVALHVGVAPARVAVAPGGAVEYVTATGSPRGTQAQAGASSLATRAVVATPLRPGRTTLLVGGRVSALAAPWAVSGLVEEGLGAVRRTAPLPTGTADVLARILEVQATEARFWDLHAGLADERAGGGRTVVTIYAGGDATALDALRFVRDPTDDEPEAVVRRPVATRNRWGSRAASVVDQRPLASRVALTSTLGGSLYTARFERDDYEFRFVGTPLNPLNLRVDTLGYDNRLREGIAAQRLDAVLGGGVAAAGYSLHLYRQRYEEQAANRARFVGAQTATRLDVHGGWEGRVLPALDLDAGLRAHLYSAGRFVRLSPRLRARLALGPHLAVAGAVGRNVQFLHRLTLGDVVGAAAWVLSDDAGTVTEADLGEATVEWRPGPLSVSVTGYAKVTRGQWLHAEDRAVRRVTDLTVLTLPWLADVEGRARGLEALVRLPLGPWSAGLAASLARADLEHPALNDGAAFPAEWDRRRRATFLADGPVVPGLWLAAAWTLASGAPNPLAAEPTEPDRLPPISRLDLRLVARRTLGPVRASLAVAVRNATDRDNVISRDPVTVTRRNDRDQLRLGRIPLDVYDAGVLPTVDLSLTW